MSDKCNKIFSDALISFLKNGNISSVAITKFQQYISDEEYETDSIQMDIEDRIGNINHATKNEVIMVRLKQFIISNKSMLNGRVYLLFIIV